MSHNGQAFNQRKLVQAHKTQKKYGILEKGYKYRVIKEFVDFDNVLHKVGEEWFFLSYSFLPYVDGLQWYVTSERKYEWIIPLCLRDSECSKIVDNMEQYIKKI